MVNKRYIYVGVDIAFFKNGRSYELVYMTRTIYHMRYTYCDKNYTKAFSKDEFDRLFKYDTQYHREERLKKILNEKF